MGVIGTIASTFSAGTSQSMSGQDNEAGNSSILISQQAFPANSNSTAFTLQFTQANVTQVYMQASANCTITTNNSNTSDVQTFAISGSPNAGYFPIAWNSNGTIVTTSVPYNTNAADLKTALQLLVGNGNINTNAAGALPGNAINATFAGTLVRGKQPVFVVSSEGLTGGTNATVTVTHAVSGAPSDTISLVAGIPRIWGASQGYGSNPFSGNVNGAFMTCNASTLLNIGIITL